MSVLDYLEKHVPRSKAIEISEYLNQHNCSLRITKPRKTKRGDFRQNRNVLAISVNHDSNSFRFLFTLVHEIAHLKTFVEHKNRVKPHGIEWKNNFEELFYTFKMDEIFQSDDRILSVVRNELRNPKACSGVSLELERVFRFYDESTGVYLESLEKGDVFKFRNHVYKKLEDRRTRVMCLNLSNSKKYTINKAAEVEIVDVG